MESTIALGAFAEPGGEDGDGGLTQELRRRGDLLGASLTHGSPGEREFALHLARLDETLAELGENLTRAAPLRGAGSLCRPDHRVARATASR